MSEEIWTPERGGFYTTQQSLATEPAIFLSPRFDRQALSIIRAEAAWRIQDPSERLRQLANRFYILQITGGGDLSLIDRYYDVTRLSWPITSLPTQMFRLDFYNLSSRRPYPPYLTEERQLTDRISSPITDNSEIARALFSLEESNLLSLDAIHQVLDYYLTVVLNIPP